MVVVVTVVTWRRCLEGHIKGSVGVQFIVPCQEGVTRRYTCDSPHVTPHTTSACTCKRKNKMN